MQTPKTDLGLCDCGEPARHRASAEDGGEGFCLSCLHDVAYETARDAQDYPCADNDERRRYWAAALEATL